MRKTSETDYDVVKYNPNAQTGILNSLVTGVFCLGQTTPTLRKMYRSFVLHCYIHQCHSVDDVCTDMPNLFKHYYAGLL